MAKEESLGPVELKDDEEDTGNMEVRVLIIISV